MYQDLATTPGQIYHLRFALAGNFNISVPTIADVLWGGVNIGSVTWNPAGHTINNLGWVWGDFDVTALSSSTRLTFSDPFVGDGSRILRVDAVSVQAVPDASETSLLLGVGLFGIFGVGGYLKNKGFTVIGR
jgi:hypothetical protein